MVETLTRAATHILDQNRDYFHNLNQNFHFQTIAFPVLALAQHRAPNREPAKTNYVNCIISPI